MTYRIPIEIPDRDQLVKYFSRVFNLRDVDYFYLYNPDKEYKVGEKSFDFQVQFKPTDEFPNGYSKCLSGCAGVSFTHAHDIVKVMIAGKYNVKDAKSPGHEKPAVDGLYAHIDEDMFFDVHGKTLSDALYDVDKQ